MKHRVCIIFILLCLAGCSRNKGIQFCEGVSPQGNGVNCGKKFETGELSVVVSSSEAFGVKEIILQVYEVKGQKNEKIESRIVAVKPDKQTIAVNVSFYAGGKYVVKAMKKDVSIGEGEIEIVDY